MGAEKFRLWRRVAMQKYLKILCNWLSGICPLFGAGMGNSCHLIELLELNDAEFVAALYKKTRHVTCFLISYSLGFPVRPSRFFFRCVLGGSQPGFSLMGSLKCRTFTASGSAGGFYCFATKPIGGSVS
ncbi:MAG: hypothetical protein WC091_17355 [Sulfuricellaceae bacterium]